MAVGSSARTLPTIFICFPAQFHYFPLSLSLIDNFSSLSQALCFPKLHFRSSSPTVSHTTLKRAAVWNIDLKTNVQLFFFERIYELFSQKILKENIRNKQQRKYMIFSKYGRLQLFGDNHFNSFSNGFSYMR